MADAPAWPDPLRVSQLRPWLAEAGVQPRRSWGQNFLINRSVRDRIVQAAGIEADDAVLELGPGAGALTLALVERCAFLVALEKDPRLAQLLQRRLGRHPAVHIKEVDALTVPWGKTVTQAAAQARVQPRRLLFLSNLPYSITGPALVQLFAHEPAFSRAVVMVQQEVGQRLVAQPGTKEYGSLTVLAAYFGEVERLFTVGPGSFWPRPAVSSLVFAFNRHASPPVVAPEADLLAVVRAAFAQRRKMLRNALAGSLPLSQAEIDAGLQAAGLDGRRRGETLALVEFARLARHLPGAGEVSQL